MPFLFWLNTFVENKSKLYELKTNTKKNQKFFVDIEHWRKVVGHKNSFQTQLLHIKILYF